MEWRFGFRLGPIFATAPADSKNNTCFKSGQKWLKDNHFDSSKTNINTWHTMKQIETKMLWRSRNLRSTSKPAASSRLTWWTCCGSRVERGPSRRRRSRGWCRSSTRSSSPFKLSWSRVPVRLSWSWGETSGYSFKVQGLIRFRDCISIFECGKSL